MFLFGYTNECLIFYPQLQYSALLQAAKSRAASTKMRYFWAFLDIFSRFTRQKYKICYIFAP